MEVRSGLQVETCNILIGQIGIGELITGFSQYAVAAGILVTVTTSNFRIIFGAAYIRQALGSREGRFGNNEIDRDKFSACRSAYFHHAGWRLIWHHGVRNSRRQSAKQHSRTCKHGNKTLRDPATGSH